MDVDKALFVIEVNIAADTGTMPPDVRLALLIAARTLRHIKDDDPVFAKSLEGVLLT